MTNPKPSLEAELDALRTELELWASRRISLKEHRRACRWSITTLWLLAVTNTALLLFGSRQILFYGNFVLVFASLVNLALLIRLERAEAKWLRQKPTPEELVQRFHEKYSKPME